MLHDHGTRGEDLIFIDRPFFLCLEVYQRDWQEADDVLGDTIFVPSPFPDARILLETGLLALLCKTRLHSFSLLATGRFQTIE